MTTILFALTLVANTMKCFSLMLIHAVPTMLLLSIIFLYHYFKYGMDKDIIQDMLVAGIFIFLYFVLINSKIIQETFSDFYVKDLGCNCFLGERAYPGYVMARYSDPVGSVLTGIYFLYWLCARVFSRRLMR